jgi:site-specific DNA-adenine methylase
MQRFRSFAIHCEDFAHTLERVPEDGFVYLDPPFYQQGQVLYKHAFQEEDHVRMARTLRSAAYRWVLSYDDHPAIRELYNWASLSAFRVKRCLGLCRAGSRGERRELIITPCRQAVETVRVRLQA